MTAQHSTPDDAPRLTLENCSAVCVHLEPIGNQAFRSVIVNRDGPRYFRPVERGKGMRDLTAGDRAIFNGRVETVIRVEDWR